MVCGMCTIDVEMLRASANYDGCSPRDRHVGYVRANLFRRGCMAACFFLLLSCVVLDARRFGWLLLTVRFFPVLCALSFFWTAFEMMSTADRRRLISFAYVNSAFPHGDGVLLRCATHPAHVALRPWGNECHGKGGGVRACIPGRSCGAWRRKASDPLAVQPIFLLPA
jgi:hypothetical protein